MKFRSNSQERANLGNAFLGHNQSSTNIVPPNANTPGQGRQRLSSHQKLPFSSVQFWAASSFLRSYQKTSNHRHGSVGQGTGRPSLHTMVSSGASDFHLEG